MCNNARNKSVHLNKLFTWFNKNSWGLGNYWNILLKHVQVEFSFLAAVYVTFTVDAIALCRPNFPANIPTTCQKEHRQLSMPFSGTVHSNYQLPTFIHNTQAVNYEKHCFYTGIREWGGVCKLWSSEYACKSKQAGTGSALKPGNRSVIQSCLCRCM